MHYILSHCFWLLPSAWTYLDSPQPDALLTEYILSDLLWFVEINYRSNAIALENAMEAVYIGFIA